MEASRAYTCLNRTEINMTKSLQWTLSLAVLYAALNDVAVAASSRSSSCTLCLQTPDIPKPNNIATSDGKTCEELSIEAQSYSLGDEKCLSHYQLLGYSECGCDTIMPDDHVPPSAEEMCTLCHDGSIPSHSDSKDFDSDPTTSTTCAQAIDYLQTYRLNSESCDNFRYKGVVNCGCPLYTMNPHSDPACSLCASDGERVSDPDRKIYTMKDQTGTTCGIMEFILAADFDGIYNDATCSSLQTYFSSLCRCEYATGAPIVANPIANSPTPTPTITYDQLPSVHPSSRPVVTPSTSPIMKPSKYPTAAPYILPSPRPSYIPTRGPNASPSVGPSHHPSTEHSQPPSFRPTYLPTISLSPSSLPTAILDKEANCTALRDGIMPQAVQFSENTNYELIFDLLLKAKKDSTSGPMGTYETARRGLQEIFPQTISPIAAGCEQEGGSARPGVNGIREKIHYVEMEEINSIRDMTCRSSSLPDDSSNLEIWCVPVSTNVNIYYSSSQRGRRRRLDETTVKEYVEKIVNDEFPELALAVNGIFSATVVGDPNGADSGGTNIKSSTGMNVGVAVGLGCSFALIVAVGIILRGKRKDNSSETANIIAGTHIRSDDSISDNPTVSSGRRGMMMGWEGSISDRSNHDTRSDVSSRRSQSVQHDDHSRGFETRQRLNETSYLPASVLKDLLGTDDVEGLSIGEDNDDLSLAPYDEGNVVDM